MVFKLPKPKRRVNEKMTLEALHKSAETYREMYDNICKKEGILQKQLDIAIWALYSLLSGKKTIKIGKSEELIETYALNKIEELNNG